MSLATYHSENRIGYITLNRPEKRNALSYELVKELKIVFAAAEKDPQAKVIVLKAVGDAFCAGADLAYLQQLQNFSFEENKADSNHLKELLLQIYRLEKVVIAQVQGHALAGGCGLANVCDFVFAVPEAKFGYTEVKIGFIPALVSVFLIRKIGEQKAKQLLLSGDLIRGEEAVRMGLVNFLAEKESLEKDVQTFATGLIKNNSAQSMQLTKRLMADVLSMTLEEALTYAAIQNAHARGTDDCKRGVAAFVNKQDITW
ncbi:MAG: enoyl-CoA hydratase/isomerase family protein [Cytophagales bacterium]